MLPGPSQRGDVAPFRVMDVFKAARERQDSHGDAVVLAAGQPSTGAPAPVRAALRAILDGDPLGYTEVEGRPELRAAIADHYRDWYGLAVDPAEVLVTTGSSGAFLVALLATFDPGARVGLATPGYPAYRNVMAALGLDVVALPTGPEHRFQPTVEVLEAHGHGLDGLVVASPANPTGTMLDPDALAAVVRWCEAHGVRVLSDEVYHGITYGRRAACAWETSRDAFVMGSFSKYFSMTGWRLGWVLVPEVLRSSCVRLAANLTICPPAPSQVAAVAAFGAYGELDGHVRRYAENRAYLLDALPGIGLGRCASPDGAFYLYVDVSEHTDDADRFWQEALAATGVAIVPGTDFDADEGRRWVRLSFAGHRSDLEEAVRRLGPWLAARRRT